MSIKNSDFKPNLNNKTLKHKTKCIQDVDLETKIKNKNLEDKILEDKKK
jgi:hypothetical protein